MKRRFIAVMLAGILSCGLVACGQGSSGSASSQETGSVASESTSVESKEAAPDSSADSEENESGTTTGNDAYPIPENTTGEVFKIGLSNAYMGNDWRQIMCSVAEWTATQEPFASNVEFDIVQSDNNAEAQIAAIQTMIDSGYDAILIDPSSTSALTNVIKEAQDAGIVVVVFDQGVDYEDVYKISTDYILRAQVGATYIVDMLGENGGNIIMDRGLDGASQGTEEYNAALAIFEEQGNINVVGTYQSQYEQGSTYTGVSSALTAADTIDAVWTQGPMTGVVQAFQDAGKDVPVIVGGGYGVYNGDALTMLDGGYDGLVWLSGMPGMSAIALYEAYAILCGEDVVQNNILNDLYLCSNNSADVTSVLDVTVNAIVEDENCWRDQADSFGWPVVPTDFFLQPEVADIFK